jgi:[ribosomal protein S5]-alanine N-acetyltransferase
MPVVTNAVSSRMNRGIIFASYRLCIMPGKLILETVRLRLQEFVEDDAEAFFALNSDPEVMQYTGTVCLTSIEQARAELCERPLADYRKYGFGRLAVVLKENGTFIGFAGLKYLDDLGEVDLGYRLMAAYWGRGFATEASRALVAHGFEVLGLKRIIGLVEPEHVRSVRVLGKSGMVFERMIDYRGQRVAQYAIERDAGLDCLVSEAVVGVSPPDPCPLAGPVNQSC